MTEEIQRQKLERNTQVIYWFKGLWALLILMPVIVPFFQSRGLGMKDIFVLQGVFSVALLVLEIPSGYISDLLGRKKTLLLAGFFWGVGYLFFPISSGFSLLVVGEIFMALGLSLASGTDVSVIYDSMEALESKKAPIKIIGKSVYYQQIGETIGGLIGGWIALVSVQSAAWVQMGVAWLPLIAVFFIEEPPRKKMDVKSHKENWSYIYRSIFKNSKILNLIILNMIFYGLSSLLAVWTFQKYWQEIEINIIYFGYLWALSNLTVALVAKRAHKIEKNWGSFRTMLLLGALPVIGYFGMALLPWFLGLICCACFQINRGINAVVLRDALNRRVSGDLRATANSISGMGMRLAFILLGPLVGYMIDINGLQWTFIALGAFYILVFFFFMRPLLGQKESFEGG